MLSVKKISTEKSIHQMFAFGVLLKGVHAVIEIIGGVLLLVISQHRIVNILSWLTHGELSEDPRDIIANSLADVAAHLSIGSQHFAALYLLSHGILKLFLVASLFKERLWAFPLSIAVFSLFGLYQLHRYTITHSSWLLVLTVFDGIVIWLAWQEYLFQKRMQNQGY